MKERDTSISFAKAIGIILMVFGHVSYSMPHVRDVIYAFHMPLFFILSGMCFNEKYISDGLAFLKRKIIGIYWPYIKWSLLFLLLHNVLFRLHIYDSYLYTIHDFISRGVHIITLMYGHEQIVGTFWFLRDLFYGSLLFYLILCITQKKVLLTTCISLVCAILMRIVMAQYSIIYSSFYAAAFISFGYLLKMYKEYLTQWEMTYQILIGTICGTVWFIGAFFFNNQEGIPNQSLQTMAPYWLSAISGSYLCIRFCKWITLHSPENKPKRLFIYIGDHTFEIMALHFLAFKIVSLCIVYIYSLPIEQLAEFPVIFSYAQQGWWMAYLFIGIAVPLGYVYCKDAIIQTIYRQK